MKQRSKTGPRRVTGVGIFFACNGLATASLLPWYPLVAGRMGLEPWQFGLIVAANAVGAITSSILPAKLVARFGAVPVAVGSTVGLAVAIAAAGWAHNGLVLAGVLFLVGLCDAVTDVAQNVVGIAVQEDSGKSILSSMHALWSLGGVAAGAASTASAGAGADMRVHLGAVGIVCIVLMSVGAVLVGRDADGYRPGPGRRSGAATAADHDGAGHDSTGSSTAAGGQGTPGVTPTSRWGVVFVAALPLAIVAMCGSMLEDVANNWSGMAAVQLGGLAPGTAGIAFTVMIGSQCVGRFTGDLIIRRRGRAWTGRLGGILVGLGGIAVVCAHEPALLLVGLALAGFGSATLVPSALAAAAALPNISRESGVTLVSWIMRAGFLATSPAIGTIASSAGLRWGLAVLLVIGVAVVVLSGRLGASGRRRVADCG